MDWGQELDAKPAKTTRLDEVPFRGPDPIAIDATCFDFCASAPFDRVVDADHNRPSRTNRSTSYFKAPSALAGRPARSAEHPVATAKVCPFGEPDGPQQGFYSSKPHYEPSADQQRRCTGKNSFGKQGSKWSHRRVETTHTSLKSTWVTLSKSE